MTEEFWKKPYCRGPHLIKKNKPGVPPPPPSTDRDMEIYSEKSLVPRNLSGINLGTTPVGTRHGDVLFVDLIYKFGVYQY